jgi:hypothetical protein
MRKEEINEIIEGSFKPIVKYFHKAIHDFGLEDIRRFRTEIKKLKVFLHLLNMESVDGLSYRITTRMKTLYGYFGIIQNLEQLKKTNEPGKSRPSFFLKMLDKELAYWKKLSYDFIEDSYDFISDKKEILAVMPDKLTKKSIYRFIHYTLYELSLISNRLDDLALDNFRKFMEDIYYNYPYIKSYFTEQQTNLFDQKEVGRSLVLFNSYRDKCMALALLQTFGTDALAEHEKKLLKQMENEYLYEKKELKNQLSAKLDSMHIKANNFSEFVFTDSLNQQ